MTGVETVWIVQQDETPDNTVLGVFTDGPEAYAFAEEIASRYPDHVITSAFPVPYRRGSGSGTAAYVTT